MRLAALVLVVFFAAAVPAGAVTLVNPDGSVAEPYQSWADAAKVPTVDDELTIVTEPGPECGLKPACTEEDVPTVWISGNRQNPVMLLHELGHRFDYSMPDWKRFVFGKIMNDTREWRTTAGNSLHEQFAVAYSFCAIGSTRPGNWWSRGVYSPPKEFGYGYRPLKISQHRRVCKLIRQ